MLEAVRLACRQRTPAIPHTDHTGTHDLGLTLQQPDQHTSTSTTSSSTGGTGPPDTGPPEPFPAGYLDNDGYYHDADGNGGGPEPMLPDDPDPDDWPWAESPAPDWLDAYPDDYQPPLPDDPDPDAAAWLIA